ncbi:hypothetical protein [Streptomyces chartreusis]|uniref:Uncharacterized protein n=1 Tax=Streptomyces chartreusis TaxID=1969 RepID=A0A7H8T067_STRCX|nr:hypothetical protein [Streptomyces chartreusis]QEV65903.1 hypothetical protein CP983_03790 [Streptomyces chartreusis]QKZ16831.1 hypothetical protein HUT05_05245 [Streptomyces chartreusis]GGW96345.1 hypothetical protein GCM10010321_07700 [Streptomyces chartreusis]
MRKRIVTVLGTLAAAFMLAITPASARSQDPSDTIKIDRAGTFQYERSCNNIYTLYVTSKSARAIKGDNPADGTAWCDGHAWLRVMGDSLGEWRNDAREVKLTSPNGKFRWAYIKGCSDCYTYIVYP